MARQYPEGTCVDCKQEAQIIAKGLCKRCYSRIWSRVKRGGLSWQEHVEKLHKEKEERSFGACTTCKKVKGLQSLGMCKSCYLKTVGRVIICSRYRNSQK
jgi:hypothetical protein